MIASSASAEKVKIGERVCETCFRSLLIDISDPEWVNAYVSWILSCLECNMDIRFTLDEAQQRGLVYYITDYITKKGLDTHSLYPLIASVVGKLEAEAGVPSGPVEKSSKLAMKILNRIVGETERSAPEVASRLLGFPDHYSSVADSQFVTLRLAVFLAQLKDSEQPAATDENLAEEEPSERVTLTSYSSLQAASDMDL